MSEMIRFVVTSRANEPRSLSFNRGRPKSAGLPSLHVLMQAVQDPTLRIVKNLPLDGYVLEMDKEKASRFHEFMAQRKELVYSRDRVMSYVKPVEEDPKARGQRVTDPTKRIDATREILRQLDPGWFDRHITGKGVTVCVIDTGIHPDPEIQNRIVGFDDLINQRTGAQNAYDDNGHGTHVAGIIAADGSTTGGRFKGVAPEAGIYAIKVLTREGYGYVSDIIAALQLAVQNKDKYGVRVVSMSLGGPVEQREEDDPLCQAVKKVAQAGIVPVIAAGNEGPGRETIANPGNTTEAITVAAWDDRNSPSLRWDKIAQWSSEGPTPIDRKAKPNGAGLGVQMVSLRSPGSYLDELDGILHLDDHHILLSGTSMATPWDAGGIACMLQANPNLTVDQVRAIYHESGHKLHFTSKYKQGVGLFDVPKAVRKAEALKHVAHDAA